MTTGWYDDPEGYGPDAEYNEPGSGLGDYPEPGFQGDPYEPQGGGYDYGDPFGQGGGGIDNPDPNPGYYGGDDGAYSGDYGDGPIYPVGDGPIVVTGEREPEYGDDFGFPVIGPVGGDDPIFEPILPDFGGGYDEGGQEVFPRRPRQNEPGVGITSRPPSSGGSPSAGGLPLPTTPRYPVPGRPTYGPPVRYPTPAGPYPTIRSVWDSGRATQSPTLTRSGMPVSTAGPRIGSALSDKTTLLAIAAGIALLYFATSK